MPSEMGIGFTDCGCVGGSDASKYPRKTMLEWREDLYRRLEVPETEANGHLLLSLLLLLWLIRFLLLSNSGALLRGF